ncbi:SDR family oxidoreductase [Halodesulfovibrio sp.]|uniref:SDR family oxidoreductase n=1 Tax=Halodesulfovibrio sp. TaxID=1912772 RepID=UPI0025ED0B1B|nr:SDR family oxidoreductase [Halodesulfovibrio sp.]MCT4626531.1 SDR family oxidoreductase [Halodesulfovibrio sp.]
MNNSSYLRLEGKVAVVTGAAGILGKVLVQHLVDHGAFVAMVDVNKEALDEVCASLGEDASVAAFPCDLSKEQEILDVVASIVELKGRIDILFNNAATKTDDLLRFFDPIEEYSMDTWREVMSVNLDGLFLMARECAKIMAQHGGGSIVQTASIYGALAPDMRIYEGSLYLGCQINTPPIYSASKGGVISLTKHLAAVWAKDGIRVNAISPGGVASGQNDVFEKNYSARIPMGRMATAQEIIDAALFLASPASGYITGQNLMVDGGLSAW